MTKQELQVLDEQQIEPGDNWIADSGVDPIVLKKAMEAAGMPATVTPAEKLVGVEIVIRTAKQFPSRFPEAKNDPYFVTGVIKRSGEIFGSVFGGGAVVELISAYIRSGVRQPLQCTLVSKEGGAFGQYYTLE